MSNAMTSLNISLPATLKTYVETQVEDGGYSTPSEYMRALVREDRKRNVEARLEALLLDGLNSGDPIEVTPEYWENKRHRLVKRSAGLKVKNKTRK